MKKRNANASKTATPVQAPERRQEEIRRRAYELYEERGNQHGRDVEDWLRAEKEITGSRSQRATRQP